MTETATARDAKQMPVKHMRQILLWPMYLLPSDDGVGATDRWRELLSAGPETPWRELLDEFADPKDFSERHYNEFVTFLPPVQRFLYGDARSASGRKGYGESPMVVLRRDDVAAVNLTLNKGDEPVRLEIAHVDLYFYFDVDVVMLALEVYVDDLDLETVQQILFRFGRAYPAFWQEDGQAGHCPWQVDWLSHSGDVLSSSDYSDRRRFMEFTCRNRAPAVAAHWAWLMQPMAQNHPQETAKFKYRLLEYYRMPFMAFIALPDGNKLSRNDSIRLALGTDTGAQSNRPYAEQYLSNFEEVFCYDRYNDAQADQAAGGVRFMASGHTFIVAGNAASSFFMDSKGGYLSRFRHQHFLMFMIAHFQKAGLRMFADRLVAMASSHNVNDLKSNRQFRHGIRRALDLFLRFAQRAWFHEVSNQAQVRDLFALTRRHLQLEPLYEEVRSELKDMGDFLEVEAARRQNETVVRLTVVTILGLVGAITTGFLGMNLFAWDEQPALWRLAAFLAVFVPILWLTLYTVVKSQRLSVFLDVMSDERAGMREKWSAFRQIWSGTSAR